MSKVTVGATMSLDGYIAGPNDTGFDLLFRWYGNGDVVTTTPNPDISFSMTPEDTEHLRSLLERTGCLVVGRHLYDLTNAWGGRHPMDMPVVVLTHNPPADRPREDENFVFVTEGIEAAVAKAREIAGTKDVGLNSGTIARQALEAGLIDEVHVDLVPVLLGAGTQYFGQFENAPVELVQKSAWASKGVVHLTYTVVDRPR
jgi:dihydrofolate reductase